MLRHLRIHRPLVFTDIETTGLDPQYDRIVEIALMKLAPGAEPRTLGLRFNPERSIPAAATAVHGIRDDHVAGCPTLADKAAKMTGFIADADLAGFGVARFDLPFLVAEFERAGRNFRLHGRKVIDALTLFHVREPRDLSAAVRVYCEHDHRQPHRARADVKAAAAVLDAMLGRYKDMPRSVPELHDLLIDVDVGGWFKRVDGVLVFGKGKHRSVPLEEVARLDPSYLRWLRDNVLPDARWLIDKAMQMLAERHHL
jgi:DNA polymerase-3 subunit epsilon